MNTLSNGEPCRHPLGCLDLASPGKVAIHMTICVRCLTLQRAATASLDSRTEWVQSDKKRYSSVCTTPGLLNPALPLSVWIE